ncbi:FtsX-like permease family protein [Streptomyces sp. NPDC048416]|uniref:FtsX-like permease family protein n=1 Tax=Streptomyces sp. NPDC048416 TaxID=3365546 RepID=UPI003711681C
MPGFVFLRVRAHRLLLTAALLAVLLTTSVLATLAAFSGSVSDAALRHLLATRSAAPAALTVTSEVKPDQRRAAADAVRAAARATFDGLPVTTRELTRSGPYALPRSLQQADAHADNPDLTLFAAMDRSRVRLTAGAWPTAPAAAPGAEIPAALPESAAARLGVRPGTTLALTDRTGGPGVTVRITGVYRPADMSDAYWRLDDLGGRGIRTLDFTTYGPLLADASVLAGGRVSAGPSAWLASADFSSVTVGRIGALRAAAAEGPKSLVKQPVFGGSATAETSLPAILDRADRSLLVSRSTLLIVALQLVLLAGYALLLVARLLSSERSGETELLRARGGSRRQIAWLAAAEALLLAVPAALVAPLLAGPLTRLLAGQGALARAGLHLDTSVTATVWLVAVLVALGCAVAVVAPALPAGPLRRGGRAGALPAPVRAGADIGLLVIAGVAYWQLDRQTSGSGAVDTDASGSLGVDPLLVAAPALALLAGTVLVLRLLPPAARLAERWAAGGRGLPMALAGWQFSRRPLRGAGPVLLLILAVAMGLLTLGQSATWNRSQSDQADFRAGTDIRVLGSTTSPFGQGGSYDTVPGVSAVAPAARGPVPMSGGRTGTVLALDTRHADGFLLREDLAGRSGKDVLALLAPARDTPAGAVFPKDTERIRLDLRLPGPSAASAAPGAVTATLEDRYGMRYAFPLGTLPADGRTHSLGLDVSFLAGAPAGRPAGPLRLTGLDVVLLVPPGSEGPSGITLDGLHAAGPGNKDTAVAVPPPAGWHTDSRDAQAEPSWDTDGPGPTTRTLRTTAPQAAPPVPAAVADDRFLESSGSKVGQIIDVPLAGRTVKVRIVARLKQLPTTGSGAVGPAGAPPVTTAADGGGLLLDLRAANRVLQADDAATGLSAGEWWLTTAPGRSADAAAALTARPDTDPAQIVSRADIARRLADDPLGAGPQSALAAVSLVAAALAAVGFSVSAAGSLRERGHEFGVLRALGTPRRQLARLIAAEQGVLIAIALLAGLGLGDVLTRAVVPLIVLTDQAAQPVPGVLVELPAGRVALLLAAVAAVPLLIVAAIALRRTDPVATLRGQGGN